MKIHATRALCAALLLPLIACAATPARRELQAAMQAIPDVEHGSELFAQCASCHGPAGGGW